MKKSDLTFLREVLADRRTWEALGSKGKVIDAPFLLWLRTQPCAHCERVAVPGVVDVVPHHIRRVRWGSGVGMKPAFSSLPLCQIPCHHTVETDPQGDHAIAGEEQWEVWRIYYPVKWAGEALLKRFGRKDWAEVSMGQLRSWVAANIEEQLDYQPPRKAAPFAWVG